MSVGAGLAHYQRIFSPGSKQQGALDRSSLPSPLSYLTRHGALVAKPRGEWVVIRCPAHKGGDEQHPSMSVSLIDGHFRCHACGAKGGDIVSLHRLATGLGFRDAVRDLGGRFHD
jgi:hypothetical protein